MSPAPTYADQVHVPEDSTSDVEKKPAKKRVRRKLYTKAAKRGRASRRKGAEGESELVNLARDLGFGSARRTAPLQAWDGDDEYPDVANIGRLWAENKRHRRVDVNACMREVLAKERPGFIRVLFHRSDGGPALATLEAAELIKLEAAALGIAKLTEGLAPRHPGVPVWKGDQALRHVYVAGPYTADDHEGVELNVARAIHAGNRLLDAGVWPYVPHLSHFQHAAKARGYEEWMALDFAWLRKCDALVRLPGKSSGADREVALAGEIGMPVFHSVEEAIRWAMA